MNRLLACPRLSDERGNSESYWSGLMTISTSSCLYQNKQWPRIIISLDAWAILLETADESQSNVFSGRHIPVWYTKMWLSHDLWCFTTSAAMGLYNYIMNTCQYHNELWLVEIPVIWTLVAIDGISMKFTWVDSTFFLPWRKQVNF